MKILTLCLFAIFSPTVLGEIKFEKVDHPKKIIAIKISNRIEYEEGIELERIIGEAKKEGFSIKNNAIMFDTKGGNTHAAQSIGRIIRERRLNTFLARNAECGSACIYALIGGVVRNVYGEVTVHRSSYSDGVPLEKIKKFNDLGDAEIYKHIYEMGISSQLAAAIIATPHWTRRNITKSELDAWSINGMDRMYEEFSTRNLASETKTSVDDVQSRLLSMIRNCDNQVQSFDMSQWECIRINYYWAMKKLPYNKIPPQQPTYFDKKYNFTKSQNILVLN